MRLAPVFLLALACSAPPDRPGATWSGQIDTLPGGVIHVANHAPRSPEPPRWHIEEEIRIGSNTPNDPAMFSQVAAVSASPAGDIVVADNATQEIRIFSPTGAYIRTLGHKGSGPGEFAGIRGIGWDDEGRMWVADPGNARYSRYDSAGTYLGDVPIRTPGTIIPWLGGLGRDGRLYDVAARLIGDRLEYRYYRMDRETGEILDTLPPMTYTPHQDPGLPMALFRMLPRFTFRFDPAGFIWFGDTQQYRLTERTLAGDTVRIVDLDRPRARVTEAEKDSVMRVLAAEPPGPEGVASRQDIPDRKPAFDRLYFDDAGHVIVEPDSRREDAGRIFDFFDDQGHYLGQARSDSAFVTFPALPFFRAGVMYGVTTDALGAEYVVRARIVPTAEER